MKQKEDLNVKTFGFDNLRKKIFFTLLLEK